MGGGGSRRYDWETKVAAARDHVENGLTKTEAMARHGIASIASLERWCRDYRSGGAQAEARTDARAGARRTGRVPEGEGRVPGKTPGPAGVQVTRRERSAVVRLLAGRGHRLDHLLRIAGLPKSTYYHHLSRPAHVSRPDVEPMVREIWERTPNGCGHRQVRMRLVHEFGTRISAKTVLRVMRRMGLRCAIRSRNPWRRYSSYRGETGDRVHNLPERDFDAARPFFQARDRRHRVQGRRLQGVPRSRVRHGQQGDRGLGREPQSGPRAAEAPARRRGADPALGHGMAVPAPMVAGRARTPRHPPVHEPQGQLPGQRGGRAGLRPLEGRVLPRPRVRLVRAVQGRAGRVHRALEHQTTARYDSRDAPRRSSGACPSRSRAVS